MSDDFMRALIQGPATRAGAGGRGADPMAEMLQGLMGGASLPGMTAEEEGESSQGMTGPSGAPGLGGLLEAIMGGGMAGAAEQAPASTASVGGLGDILGAILGGGMPATGTQPAAGTGGAGGLADILGAILGGGASASAAGTQANPIINAIVTGLADKLGLPPQIAHIVVTFVMAKLLKRRAEVPASTPQAEGLDLDNLLDKMNRGQTLRQADVRGSSLVQELSRQTGLDSRDASASLAYVLNELGGEYGSSAQPAAPGAPRPEGLKNLLDTW